MTDPTYSETNFLKDLRFQKNERLEAAWLEDWDKRGPKLAESTPLRDTYGYFAMFVLGFVAGALVVLCSIGR